MITAPDSSKSFYVIHAVGEAAELITSVFSAGCMGDIANVTVLSREYNNDIEPINEMDATIETIKSGLGSLLVENVTFNPLYIPMSIDALDEALDVEVKNDAVRFAAMEGNPFAIKTTNIKTGIDGQDELLAGTVAYQQFELPEYQHIMDKQLNSRLH